MDNVIDYPCCVQAESRSHKSNLALLMQVYTSQSQMARALFPLGMRESQDPFKSNLMFIWREPVVVVFAQ
eukprot:3449144-Amphidinium_carterae.1